MNLYLQAFACLALLFIGASCKDKKVDRGLITIDAKGKSGKVEICQKKNEKRKRKGKCVTFQVDDIREVDSNGDEVDCKKIKHKYPTMASTDYSMSDLEETTFQGLNVSYFNFSTTLQSKSAFAVDLYMFREAGNYTFGDEEVAVLAGDVKIAIRFEDWMFCGKGSGEDSDGLKTNGKTGSQILARIEIKGKGKAKKKVQDADKEDGKKRRQKGRMGKKGSFFNLGDDEEGVFLSGNLDVDGSIKEMLNGYPKLETKGSKDLFTFAFPKGARVLYDPTIALVDVVDGADWDDNGVTSTTATLSVLIISFIVTCFLH